MGRGEEIADVTSMCGMKSAGILNIGSHCSLGFHGGHGPQESFSTFRVARSGLSKGGEEPQKRPDALSAYGEGLGDE